MIILTAIVFGAATFCYCEFKLEERYAATGSVVVTNGGILEGNNENSTNTDGDKVNNTDITASVNLLDTIQDVLITKDIYEDLAAELTKIDGVTNYTAGQLKSFATISKRDDFSLFIDVKFEMNNPDEAIIVTDKFLELTPEYIREYIPNATTKYTKSDGSAPKTYPRTFVSVLIAMVIGAILAFVTVYIISLFNTTIQTEEDFKERYNIPVLGDIPDFTAAKSGKYAKSYYKGGSYYGN